jgi:hypothetical protein
MANAYLEIEEYLWFTEYQQGNVNVAGLVFDDLLEETLDLGPEEVLTVYSDEVEETLDFADDPRRVGGQHWMVVSDTFLLGEIFGGSATRVKQSVLNVVYTKPVMPIKIAHMHLDVVMSAASLFMEEVSSELQIRSAYANAVPYYWEQLFESFNIEMAEPQPYLPIYLKLLLSASDLVNMRHDVTQEYLFNSYCREELFIWDVILRGWDHLVADSLVNTDTIKEIIGKIADDYLYLEAAPVPGILVLHLIDDRVFLFDASDAERYYLLLADETIEITDGEVSFVDAGTIGETMCIRDTVSPQTVFMLLATESLAFVDIDSFIHGVIVEEGLGMGDVDLARWVFNVLVESGCDTSDIIA